MLARTNGSYGDHDDLADSQQLDATTTPVSPPPDYGSERLP